MAITKIITREGQNQKIKISGDVGAKFEIYVKQGSNYYNWDTSKFQTLEKILKFQEIPNNGIYTNNVGIPTVTSDTSYDFYVRPISGSTSSIFITNEQKIGTLYQKSTKTATFTTTSAASLVIQNSGSAGTDLTGGTLTSINKTLTQTGTITKSGSPLIYVHETPSWNKDSGGNWTNSNLVKHRIESINGTEVKLEEDGGDNISSGYSVTGDGIIDEITVSAISGDIITLSAAQNLKVGNSLIFSKSEWQMGPITATITGSGTTSVSMTQLINVSRMGIADVTCVCVVDSFVSVKPNAFPISVDCPVGGTVRIEAQTDCTNYLGQLGDNDANQTDKRYIIHSIPSAATSSIGASGYGTLSLAAAASMGSAGAGVVDYTASDVMKAGDTDYFYYKTQDAQSTPVDSATDQGKVSITII